MCRQSQPDQKRTTVTEVLRRDFHCSSPSLRMQFIGAENVLQQTSQRAENAHVIRVCSVVPFPPENLHRQ
jgi:hypothetical protein